MNLIKKAKSFSGKRSLKFERALEQFGLAQLVELSKHFLEGKISNTQFAHALSGMYSAYIVPYILKRAIHEGVLELKIKK